MRRRWIVPGLMAFAGFCTTAYGCSCASAGPCHRLTLKNTLFVGTALSETIVPPVGEQFRQREYTFLVVETFHGVQQPGDKVKVRTGMGGGDCGFGFRIGERYLVDAFDDNQKLQTGICNLTGSERTAMATIRELRALVSGGRVPDLTSRVAVAASQAYPVTGNSRSLEAIPVLVTQSAGGHVYRTATDADGLYTFGRLPAGEYKIHAELPFGLAMSDFSDTQMTERARKIDVPRLDGDGAACQLDVAVSPTGSISGRVVDVSGSGVRGSILAYPSPSEGPLERYQWASMAQVGPDGRFEIRGLRAGDFQLMFQYEPPFDGDWAHRKPMKLFYYDHATSLTGGAKVLVPEGGASLPVQFTLPPGYER